jgi:GntR family transcriptional regulator
VQLSVIDGSPTRRKADNARRVRDLLRAQILGRGFPDGQMPSEGELMGEFQVGRNVVRAALAHLQRQGLIARIQGAGTFVVVQKTRHNLLAGGIGSSMAQLDTRLVSQRRGLAGVGAAVRLGIPADQLCLIVDVVSSVNRQPVTVATSYIGDPALQEAVAAVIGPGWWPGDWYAALAAAGLEVAHRELVIEAVVADDLVAADLEIELGDPLMFVERRLLLADGTPAEYGFAHCRGDRFALACQVGPVPPSAGLS